MTYTTLSGAKTAPGSIMRWVNYSQLDIATIIEEAQALIFQTLRVRQMRTVFPDIAVVAGDSETPLPDGFLDPLALTDKTNNVKFSLYPEENIEGWRFYDGGALVRTIPTRYGIYDEKLQFECAYESAATLKLVGYKAPAFISQANDSNFLVARYPHLMRVACLAQAYDFMSNKSKRDDNLSMLVSLIERTNAESDLSYRGVNLEVQIG